MASTPKFLRAFSRSVFLQVLVLGALVTAVVATALTVQSAGTIATVAKKGIQSVAQENMSNLTAASGGALKFGKVEVIEALLDPVVNGREDAYFAMAVDAKGEIVAELGSISDAEHAAMRSMLAVAMDNQKRQVSPDGFMIGDQVVFGKGSTVVGAIGTVWTPDAIMRDVNRDTSITIAVAFALFVGLMIVFGVMLKRMISTPLEKLGETMTLISEGDYSVAVPSRDRQDEIGTIAASLDRMLDRLRDAQEASRLREKAGKDQECVVQQLTQALHALSEGDLGTEIKEPFPEAYDGLRTNLNNAKRNLRQMVSSVIESSEKVRNNVGEIASASDHLAHRTESQAATLEETAAALEQMTASIKSSAEMVKAADGNVSNAQKDASAGEEVVQGAVSAMKEIEVSSRAISQIIGVIDDIAFQTNLLALNAGVEAARAGEHGRGFAVVAAEVRGLAQRASEAAKEINGLIRTSVQQVEHGNALVVNAGEALQKIVSNTDTIRKLVVDITVASSEQSSGLTEINAAMTTLDMVTQQNAAMVEEATASCTDLNVEAELLVTLTQGFAMESDSRSYALHSLESETLAA